MKKAKSKFVQDFLPVKNIRHGIVETTDGRYIKILEIEPINFMLLSDEEQGSVISSFASWLKISPARIQFKSITRKADSDKHLALLQEDIEREADDKCRLLGEGYVRLIKDVGNREALTRRFFLILQYESQSVLAKSLKKFMWSCKLRSKMPELILRYAVIRYCNRMMSTKLRRKFFTLFSTVARVWTSRCSRE